MTRRTRLDPPSLGYPKLWFSLGGRMSTHEPQREFALVDEVTTIGSDADADLRLTGLEAHHAEIRLDEHDNYTYVPLCDAAASRVHGRYGIAALLRTGTLIRLGKHTVSFSRDEFADGCAPVSSIPGIGFAQERADAHQAHARTAARELAESERSTHESAGAAAASAVALGRASRSSRHRRRGVARTWVRTNQAAAALIRSPAAHFALAVVGVSILVPSTRALTGKWTRRRTLTARSPASLRRIVDQPA